MTSIHSPRALAVAALIASLVPLAVASPGAHGPNGEHLDGPSTTVASAGSRPRLEAKTEQFELVATLGGGELSMLIDRFTTNEPVLDAQVEVESGGLKAKAPFHADLGDYAVADEAMMKLLSKPGEHALVITVIQGSESDLLDGTLKVSAAQSQTTADAPNWPRRLAIGVAVLAIVLLTVGAWRRRGGAFSKGGQA